MASSRNIQIPQPPVQPPVQPAAQPLVPPRAQDQVQPIDVDAVSPPGNANADPAPVARELTADEKLEVCLQILL